MPFIVFDRKDTKSFDIPAGARAEMIARIDRDYPPYVTSIPSIYDVVSRHCFNGVDECVKYLVGIGQPETHEEETPDPEPTETVEDAETMEDTVDTMDIESSPQVVATETPEGTTKTAQKKQKNSASSKNTTTEGGMDGGIEPTVVSEPTDVTEPAVVQDPVPEAPPKKKTTRRKKVTVDVNVQ